MKSHHVKITQQTTLIFLSVCVLWGLTSCSSVKTAEKSTNTKDSRVIYISGRFKTKISVLDLKQRDMGGLLQASATLKNNWPMALRFQYQFRFFDHQGFPIEQDSRPWTPILITGRDRVNVTSIAPNKSAKTFNIVIQK